MKIADLQKRYDEAAAAIEALKGSMPNREECAETIFMERNGERVKNDRGDNIELAIVAYVPDRKIQIRDEQLPYIIIGNGFSGNSNLVRIPVEAIKPLIKILEGLI